MKRFMVAHHSIAIASVVAIATSLNQGAVSATRGVNSIVLTTDKDDTINYRDLFSDAIGNIDQAIATIEKTFADFRNGNGGATEARDFGPVIDNLIAAGYIRQESPVVERLKDKGLDHAFSKLDLLANTAKAKLLWARDNITADGSDSYLGYTMPMQIAIDEMISFARELQVVVSATWREYQNMPTFVVTTGQAQTQKTVAA